jgi:hypothetical protein
MLLPTLNVSTAATKSCRTVWPGWTESGPLASVTSPGPEASGGTDTACAPWLVTLTLVYTSSTGPPSMVCLSAKSVIETAASFRVKDVVSAGR